MPPKTFDNESRRRIGASVKVTEGQRPRPAGEGGPPIVQGDNVVLSKNTGTVWSKGTTRTVNIWSGSTQGSETDTGIQLAGVYNRMGDIPANNWLYIREIAGLLEVWVPEC